MDRPSYGLSTSVTDDPNTLTHQSVATYNKPRYQLSIVSVTWNPSTGVKPRLPTIILECLCFNIPTDRKRRHHTDHILRHYHRSPMIQALSLVSPVLCRTHFMI